LKDRPCACPPRKNCSRHYRKYGNVPTEASDGTKCASKKEAERYSELLLRQKAGKIRNLRPHPSWELIVNRVLIGKYTADASYWRNGVFVVEDVKQPHTRTQAYKLRVKLLKALYGIEVTEV